MFRRLRYWSTLCLALLAIATPPLAAQQVDVLRGRVTGQDNEPLENVAIIVTSISGNVNRTTRTDRQGRFTVTFPNGDGDYMVTINAVGFAQKRFEVKRAADEDVLLADAKLTRVGTVLDASALVEARRRVGAGHLDRLRADLADRPGPAGPIPLVIVPELFTRATGRRVVTLMAQAIEDELV